ncbi:GH25 family lysozyme [Corynebacterium sp. DNF00584]|uniref:GH25 family lysozyme n=2 Tax=Bacillati TaxID=1783272 RepID=UPI00079B75C5|nr:GH25 family lysozyme [Corynebacterium sp. DNF00584]KXB52717.1 glycosyl hydrolase family 25 [Corynebacterium sp. DNF00584]
MTTMPVQKGFYVTSPIGARWGTTHWGTDFGRDGGSGGYPIYAVKDGTIIAAGPASGFGRWIRLDHPASVGGGESVYGHIIPEVATGEHVREGQRIGRINPNSATNGGVPPHLHFEFYRYSWVAPAQRVLGETILDPEVVLRDARWPGEPGGDQAAPGVIFGIDVSEHQDGMSLAQAKREGIDFAIIRTTDGTYKDRCYRSHLEDAESAGMLTAAYHYLRNPSEGTSVAQQVQASLEVMGDKKRPLWIDVETNAGLHVDHIRACKAEFERRGVRVIGAYSYVPYWEGRISPHEPDSHEFGAFWVAAYGGNPRGKPRDIYPGDHHRQWDYPLGNQKPALWQFGSNAQVAGYSVDINAYRGSRAQLETLFTGKQEQELSMADIQRILEHIDRKTEETKRYVDIRITDPIGSDVKDIRQQITGGRDKILREDGTVDIEASYPGWKHLGVNEKGKGITPVDALAHMIQMIVRIERKLDQLLGGEH